MIIDSIGFSVYHSCYYDNDFGKRERKKYVKTTICVDGQSQIIVTCSVGEIHDSKEFEIILKRIGNYEITLGWNGILGLDKLNGWISPSPLDTLPTFSASNYTVIFTRSKNNIVCIYSIVIKGSTYLI